MEQALADVEIILSAYPDETTTDVSFPTDGADADDEKRKTVSFPLHVTLRLSETAHCTLELRQGYPTRSNIQISSYRSRPNEKARMEATVAAIRATAQKCLEEGVEGGLACCAIAFETWNDLEETNGEQQEDDGVTEASSSLLHPHPTTEKKFEWISGEPLMDRKSTFQAHVCGITSESDVKLALQQLMDSSPKLHRATHNMLAWRLRERMKQQQQQQKSSLDDGMMTENTTGIILKHDNDDDGEDAAGSRLAHLLEMRNEDGVLIVVSRWFGGVHLGPKRFAHITNVARQLLSDWHEKKQQQQQQSRK